MKFYVKDLATKSDIRPAADFAMPNKKITSHKYLSDLNNSNFSENESFRKNETQSFREGITVKTLN